MIKWKRGNDVIRELYRFKEYRPAFRSVYTQKQMRDAVDTKNVFIYMRPYIDKVLRRQYAGHAQFIDKTNFTRALMKHITCKLPEGYTGTIHILLVPKPGAGYVLQHDDDSGSGSDDGDDEMSEDKPNICNWSISGEIVPSSNTFFKFKGDNRFVKSFNYVITQLIQDELANTCQGADLWIHHGVFEGQTHNNYRFGLIKQSKATGGGRVTQIEYGTNSVEQTSPRMILGNVLRGGSTTVYVDDKLNWALIDAFAYGDDGDKEGSKIISTRVLSGMQDGVWFASPIGYIIDVKRLRAITSNGNALAKLSFVAMLNLTGVGAITRVHGLNLLTFIRTYVKDVVKGGVSICSYDEDSMDMKFVIKREEAIGLLKKCSRCTGLTIKKALDDCESYINKEIV